MFKALLVVGLAVVGLVILNPTVARAQCVNGVCRSCSSSATSPPARAAGPYCYCEECSAYYVCPCEQLGRDCGCQGGMCPHCAQRAKNDLPGGPLARPDCMRRPVGRLFSRLRRHAFFSRGVCP